MVDGQLSLQCDCTPVGDVRYDRDGDRSPTEAVVMAIAALTNTEPTDVAPLYESIDVDALDRLFENRSAGRDPSETVLGFTVNGWNVFVRDDGRIRVCDPAGPDDPSPVFD